MWPLRPLSDDQIRAVAEADVRAAQMLLGMLSPAQAETLKLRQHFDVTGSLGGRYRVWAHISVGNVQRLDDGSLWCTYGHRVPRYDTLLAQALLIRTDEGAFLETANRIGVAV